MSEKFGVNKLPKDKLLARFMLKRGLLRIRACSREKNVPEAVPAQCARCGEKIYVVPDGRRDVPLCLSCSLEFLAFVGGRSFRFEDGKLVEEWEDDEIERAVRELERVASKVL